MFSSIFAGTTASAVRSRTGVIRLQDAELFADPSAEACCRFVERSLTVADVTAVEIDHRWRQAAIRYAGTESEAVMLERLAAALQLPAVQPIEETLRGLLAWNPRRQQTCIYRYGDTLSAWEVQHLGRQRVQLRHEVVTRYRPIAWRVCDELGKLPGVQRVSMWPLSSSLVLQLDDAVDLMPVLSVADSAVQWARGPSLEERVAAVVEGTVLELRRIVYLLLAGVSLGMAIVGAIVPGIPTVPFVLLTSYFLVRSSPALNERLLNSRVFGPMVRDWQQQRGVRRHVKWVILGVTAVLLTVGLIFVDPSLPLLLFTLLFAAFSVAMITLLPTIPPPARVAPGTP